MRPGALAPMLAAMAFSAAAAQRDPILLRIDNQSGSPTAVSELTPELRPLLEKKGWETVADAKDASVLTVTISVYLGPKARTRGPKSGGAAGVSAVLVKPGGEVAWRNSVATVGQDEKISYTNLRRADPRKALASGVAEKLLWTLPRAPSAVPVTVAAASASEEAAPAVVSTRYEAPRERDRGGAGVARFPMKKDRGRR